MFSVRTQSKTILHAFAAMLLCATLAAAQVPTYQATVLADHPIVYYRLGEPSIFPVALDTSGNNHTGTYENFPVLAEPPLIMDTTNTAVDFTTGDVVIPNYSDLNFIHAPFTIEAWINVEVFASKNIRVFDKSDAGYPLGYGLDVGGNNVRLLGGPNFAPSFNLSVGTTYYIVGVSDGAGTGYIYVNGSLVASGPYASVEPYRNVAHIAIASDGSSHFNGVIDEVAVYNYALSSERIAVHYEVGAGI
jgi:hypothetical protein